MSASPTLRSLRKQLLAKPGFTRLPVCPHCGAEIPLLQYASHTRECEKASKQPPPAAQAPASETNGATVAISTTLSAEARQQAQADLAVAEDRIARRQKVLAAHSISDDTRAVLEEQLEGWLLERYMLRSILGARSCSCGRTYFTKSAQCPRCDAIDASPCRCGNPNCTAEEASF